MLKFLMKKCQGILGLVLMMTAGCGGGGLDHLGYQRSVWAAKKPISYRFKINYGSWIDSCYEMQVVVPASGEPQVTMTPESF